MAENDYMERLNYGRVQAANKMYGNYCFECNELESIDTTEGDET